MPMRFSRTERSQSSEMALTGSFLVAHPSLLDPNFRKTVVLLTAYSSDDGALGVIVNRPTGQTLGEYKEETTFSGLESVPVYKGGPVAENQLILAAWKWCLDEGSFKLYFGINELKALEIMEQDPDFKLFAFLGHSGWGESQLEGELEETAWIVSGLLPEFETMAGEALWRDLLLQKGPEMRLLIDEPEDPSVN